MKEGLLRARTKEKSPTSHRASPSARETPPLAWRMLYRSHFVVGFLNCYFRSNREYTPFCLTMTSDVMKCKIVLYLKGDIVRIEIRKGSNNDFEC